MGRGSPPPPPPFPPSEFAPRSRCRSNSAPSSSSWSSSSSNLRHRTTANNRFRLIGRKRGIYATKVANSRRTNVDPGTSQRRLRAHKYPPSASRPRITENPVCRLDNAGAFPIRTAVDACQVVLEATCCLPPPPGCHFDIRFFCLRYRKKKRGSIRNTIRVSKISYLLKYISGSPLQPLSSCIGCFRMFY